MKRHGSMNRSFRFVCNSVHHDGVAVGESSRARGNPAGRLLTSVASSAVLLFAGVPCWSGPQGGQLVSGTAAITQTGAAGQAVTTVQQSSERAAIQWQSFNLGPQERVTFLQPSATSLAVNRILDTQGSQILGRIQANGQVWLINPNGVLFGRQAQVDVAGLVASTLDRVEVDASGAARWTGTSRAAVVNQGQITAAPGGHVALLGHEVVNDGVMSARLGTVALGAGSDITLKLRGNSLLSLQVDGQLLNAQAANGGLLRADGGQVLVTAGARDSLLASAVNNTGIVEARAVQEQAGRIVLLAGMAAGTMQVSGVLDASAPAGGAGGFIETSGARVRIADGIRVNTQAVSGAGGRWLIDPTDFTVAASGGDISGATLSANLASNHVELQSPSGDVNVNDAVTWSSNKVLTLTAANSVNLNANITATSNSPSAGLSVNFGTGGFNLAEGVTVNLPNVPASSQNALVINGTPYTVINRLGASTDAARQSLQGLKNDVDGLAYALGSDIDASATATWNRGAGFQPIGTFDVPFAGTFNGLGHRITNLTINRANTDNVGLFGYASGATLSDVHLVNASVRGRMQVGALAGYQDNMIERSSASGTVTGLDWTGGLVGYNDGIVSRSSASAAVAGASFVGGLVGRNDRDQVISSRATGPVSGSGDRVGGLVGDNRASVVDSQASGAVNAGTAVGGLVGWNEGSITGSQASGVVNGVTSVGGLVGYNGPRATVETSQARGVVSAAQANAGGLVGENDGSVASSNASGSAGAADSAGGLVGLNGVLGTVETSQASGAVNALRNAGGLVGDNQGIVADSRASGAVSGVAVTGGLAGNNDGEILRSRASGRTTAQADAEGLSAAGGLVGFNNGTVRESYATGEVSGTGSAVGGLVGNNLIAVIDSHASGTVSGADAVGGLVGLNSGSVERTLSRGAVTGSGAIDRIGGLVGFNDDGGSVASSYWDVVRSGRSASGGGVDGGVGLGAAAMLQSASFAGFDFSSKWVQVEGLSQPLLRSLLTPLTVSVDRGVAPTKTYDGTRSVPDGQVRYSANGTAVTPDTTLLQGTLTGALDSRHVGVRTVTLSGLFSTRQEGYLIDYSSSTITVTPASLTVAARPDSKVYDGGLASKVGPTASGLLGSDAVVNATQAFASRHVLGQGGSTLAVTGYVVQDGNEGRNYTVTTSTATGTITPAPLTISAVKDAKAYDGTSRSSAAPTVSGLLGSDTIQDARQVFTYRHAFGVGGSVLRVAGYALNDGNAGANYSVNDTATAAGTITMKRRSACGWGRCTPR